MTIGPITEPNKAVKMTKTAVTAGIPPIISETLIAIGVVTERGMRLSIRSALSLNSFAINAVDRMAMQLPTATLMIISTAYFLKSGSIYRAESQTPRSPAEACQLTGALRHCRLQRHVDQEQQPDQDQRCDQQRRNIHLWMAGVYRFGPHINQDGCDQTYASDEHVFFLSFLLAMICVSMPVDTMTTNVLIRTTSKMLGPKFLRISP